MCGLLGELDAGCMGVPLAEALSGAARELRSSIPNRNGRAPRPRAKSSKFRFAAGVSTGSAAKAQPGFLGEQAGGFRAPERRGPAAAAPPMGRRRGGHGGLPIRHLTPAEDTSAAELWFDSWFDIRTYEDLVTVEQGDGELFGIWPRLHMRAAPLVVIHLETLVYVAAERLWPPCAPRLQVRPGCVELVASMKEVVQLAVIARRDPDAMLALRELRERGCSFDAVVIEGGGDAVVEGGGGTRPQQRWLNWLDHPDICSAFGVPPHEAAARILCVGTIALSHVDVEAKGSDLGELLASGEASPPWRYAPPCSPPLPVAAEAAPVALLLPDPRNEASRRAVHCRLVEELLRELLLLGWEAGAFGGGGGGWPAAFAALERDDIIKAHHTPAGSGGLRGAALVLRDTRVGRSHLCALEALPLRREVRGTGYPTGWTLLSRP